MRPTFRPTGRRDGRRVYLLTNQDREFLALASMDPGTGAITVLHAPDWDVEMLAYSASGRIAYATNVDGFSELAVLESEDGSPRSVAGLPRGVITTLAWSGDGSRLAAAVSSETRPSDVWVVEAPSLEARQLTHSDLGGLADDAFTPSTLVHYPTFDGQQVPAFFHLPPGAERSGDLPVLVYVHGGPEAQSRPGFSPIVQYFAHRGYAVLVTNVRGSTGYGRTYVHQDDVEKRMDAVRDLKHAVDWLVESGYSRPERIAVMGGSYGGFMTLAAVTTIPTSGAPLWSCTASPTSTPSWRTQAPGVASCGRRSTATRIGTPTCCGRSPPSTAWIGFGRRLWRCTAPGTLACPSGRRSRSSLPSASGSRSWSTCGSRTRATASSSTRTGSEPTWQ